MKVKSLNKKRKQMHTQGRQPCGGRSRNWSNDAGIRQGTLRITSHHQELGERQGEEEERQKVLLIKGEGGSEGSRFAR